MAGDKWVAPAGGALTEGGSTTYESTFAAGGDIGIGSTIRITASGEVSTVDTGQIASLTMVGPSANPITANPVSFILPDDTVTNFGGAVGWTAVYTETLRSVSSGTGTWAYSYTITVTGQTPVGYNGTRTRTIPASVAWTANIGFDGSPDPSDTLTLDQAFAEWIG